MRPNGGRRNKSPRQTLQPGLNLLLYLTIRRVVTIHGDNSDETVCIRSDHRIALLSNIYAINRI